MACARLSGIRCESKSVCTLRGALGPSLCHGGGLRAFFSRMAPWPCGALCSDRRGPGQAAEHGEHTPHAAAPPLALGPPHAVWRADAMPPAVVPAWHGRIGGSQEVDALRLLTEERKGTRGGRASRTTRARRHQGGGHQGQAQGRALPAPRGAMPRSVEGYALGRRNRQCRWRAPRAATAL